jgi:hypothetical protein
VVFLMVYIDFFFCPLLPSRCRCRGLLLHLITLNDTHIHTLTHTHSFTHTHTQTLIHNHSRTHLNTHTLTHTHTHTNTHTHTHTHTHTNSLIHTHTHRFSRTPWTRDWPVAKATTCTTNTQRDKHPRPRRDSNP